MEYVWNILKDGNDIVPNLGNYGILILNRPITLNPQIFSKLWTSAAWRITVDGGTDHWFDFKKEHDLNIPFPDQVTGDFDSIKPETLQFCKEQSGIDVIHTPDQDRTDFNKALTIMFESCKVDLDYFLAHASHSGRIDQTYSNINALSREKVPGFIFDSDCLTWLLLPGVHRISIPLCLREKQEWCGILPFKEATIKSSGLKWNLDHWKVEFGGLISSSNTYSGSEEVTVETDKSVLWTMSLGELFR